MRTALPNDHFEIGDERVSAEASASADTPLSAPKTEEEIDRCIQKFHQRRSCKVIVDSSSDFAPSVLKRLGLEYIPISYVTPEGERLDDLWESQTPHDFYEAFRQDPTLHYTTAAITPGRYLEVFERAAKEGVPTIYLALSAGLSSTIYNAEQAAEMVREKYPDFELYVLDPCCDSASVELLALECMRQAGLGLSAKEVYEWACDARYFVHGYFILDGFGALAAGGRIPPAAAQVGTKLDIKPELTYETNGSLSLRGIHRGRRKALRAILQDFRDNYCQDTTLPLAIVSSDAEKDADWLEAQVRKEKGLAGVTIIRSSISPILGTHVGPGMVGFTFWGGDRREKMSLTDRIARKVRSFEQ